MNKTAGKYVIDGAKLGNRYLTKHASKFFVMWIIAIAKIIGNCTIFMMPIFQKISTNLAKMIDETGEVVYSKCLDDSEGKHSYSSLLVFDVICILFMLAGAGLCIGIAYFIQYVAGEIAFNSVTDTTEAWALYDQVFNACWYIYIPFGIIALVYVVFCLIVLQAGVHISAMNPTLSASDIAYNAMTTVKNKGGRLFFIDLLYFIEVATLGGIGFLVFFLIDYFLYNPDDPTFSLWIFNMVLPALVLIAFFVLPVIFLSAHISVHRFMNDYGHADRMIVAFRKGEDVIKDNPFVQLSPVENANGEVVYINMDEVNQKNKEEKKGVDEKKGK